MRQAELFGGGVVGTKDASERAVQIGADGGDCVEASLCGRCPNSSNVKERANQVQQSFEEQHARSGVVVGCQASRSPKSVLRGDPQIVRAGGVERWLALSHNGSDVLTNWCQRAVGVVQDLGRRPRVGGSVAVLRKVGRRGCFAEVHQLELLPSRSATPITNPGRSTMMARSASLSGRAVPRAWEPKSRTPRVVGSAANSSTNAVITGFIGSCLANCTGRCHVAGLGPELPLKPRHLAPTMSDQRAIGSPE